MRTLLTALVLSAGCGGDEPACDDGDLRCTDYDVLESCADHAWVEAEDCAAKGMICHDELGHCMMPNGTMM